jgi:hypothetical protein
LGFDSSSHGGGNIKNEGGVMMALTYLFQNFETWSEFMCKESITMIEHKDFE